MNIWILAYARTGSTYFRDLLSHTGLFGTNKPFRECLHHSVPFKKFRENFDKNPQLYNQCKVLRSHFEHKFTDDNKEYIENKLPNLKYVLIKRDDIIASTVSLYFAEKTRLWNTNDINSVKTVASKQIPYDKPFLLKCYNDCKHCYQGWNKYLIGSDFFKIEYNDLCENPFEIIKGTLKFLDINHKNQDIELAIKKTKTQKIIRPETAEYMEKLNQLVHQPELIDFDI